MCLNNGLTKYNIPEAHSLPIILYNMGLLWNYDNLLMCEIGIGMIQLLYAKSL